MAAGRPLILDRFQAWARTAPAGGRADGVRMIAKALLETDLGAAGPDAVTVLAGFLDDPSPLVRTALAEALADHPRAPHHLVLALADDQPAIAAIVAARSPVLDDGALADCAARVAPAVQSAISTRRSVSAALAAALAEVVDPTALAALAANRGAVLSAPAIRRMLERSGDDAGMREALLARGDLPADVRLLLVAGAARTLASFVVDCGWLSRERVERVAAEARDRAALVIDADVAAPCRTELASHLRGTGQFTIALAFRTLLSGRQELFGALFRESTGASTARVEGALRRCGGGAFAALCRDAGMPEALLPGLRAAVRAAAEIAPNAGGLLSLAAVRRVIAAVEALRDDGAAALASLLPMLRRFEVEAARDEAKARGLALVARQTPFNQPLQLRDADDAAATRGDGTRRPRYTIDLAAIEAQLCAA